MTGDGRICADFVCEVDGFVRQKVSIPEK